MNDPKVQAHLDKAEEHFQASRESFDRCDTDGFVSQWCHDLNGQLERMKADLEAAGNMAEFPIITDLDGNKVPAKHINGRYGPCWAITDAQGGFTGEFVKDGLGEKAMAKRGYKWSTELAPAKAVMHGSGYGTAGLASVRPIIVRADDPRAAGK